MANMDTDTAAPDTAEMSEVGLIRIRPEHVIEFLESLAPQIVIGLIYPVGDDYWMTTNTPYLTDLSNVAGYTDEEYNDMMDDIKARVIDITTLGDEFDADGYLTHDVLSGMPQRGHG